MDVRIAETCLDRFDLTIELDLGIIHTDVANSLGVNKDDVLFAGDEQPENEIGMEVAGLKESDTPSLAQIAE